MDDPYRQGYPQHPRCDFREWQGTTKMVITGPFFPSPFYATVTYKLEPLKAIQDSDVVQFIVTNGIPSIVDGRTEGKDGQRNG